MLCSAVFRQLSYGWHRAEIIGAITSVLLIWIVTVVLVWEAVRDFFFFNPHIYFNVYVFIVIELIKQINRIKYPEEVNGKFMFILAAGGLCINLLMMFILTKAGHGHSHGGLEDHSYSHSHGHSHSHGNTLHETEDVNIRSAYIHVIGGMFCVFFCFCFVICLFYLKHAQMQLNQLVL